MKQCIVIIVDNLKETSMTTANVTSKSKEAGEGINKKYSFPVYDLTPTDKAEGVECYTYMLDEALKREKVTNIAIAGRYGSGKSSFLNTFFKARKNETGLPKKEKKNQIHSSVHIPMNLQSLT